MRAARALATSARCVKALSFRGAAPRHRSHGDVSEVPASAEDRSRPMFPGPATPPLGTDATELLPSAGPSTAGVTGCAVEESAQADANRRTNNGKQRSRSMRAAAGLRAWANDGTTATWAMLPSATTAYRILRSLPPLMTDPPQSPVARTEPFATTVVLFDVANAGTLARTDRSSEVRRELQ